MLIERLMVIRTFFTAAEHNIKSKKALLTSKSNTIERLITYKRY